MVSPEVPRCCPVRETVLDDRADGCRDDTVGVTAPRQGEVRHVSIEVLLAARAKMLGVPDVDIDGPFGSRVAKIVEDPILALVAVGTPVTVRTRPAPVVAAALDELRLREVLNALDPLCSIRTVLPGCGHFSSLQAKNFFSPGEIGSVRPWT